MYIIKKLSLRSKRVSEISKIPKGNEYRRAFDVKALAEDEGVNVVSAVRSYGNLGPFRPRYGVDFRGVRLFDVLLREQQVLCSSTVAPGDTGRNLYGKWGVVIGSGTIEQAFPYDATTTVVDDEVTSIFLDRLKDMSPEEQIASALNSRTQYNEVNVRANSIAGVYFCVNENEDPSDIDLPSDQTRQLIEELSIPAFLLRDGEFSLLRSSYDLNSATEPVAATELTDYGINIDAASRNTLAEYLTNNLVLAPRNAVSSGVARGDFAHEFRAKDQPYQYEDFLLEQSKFIAHDQRPSLQLYGAMALHQFSIRAEVMSTRASDCARRMAQKILSISEFEQYVARIESDGNLQVKRDDIEHYLSTGRLPGHLSDH